MPEGKYCDLISGMKNEDGQCSGLTVTVDSDRKVQVDLPHDSGERMLAFTIEVGLV